MDRQLKKKLPGQHSLLTLLNKGCLDVASASSGEQQPDGRFGGHEAMCWAKGLALSLIRSWGGALHGELEPECPSREDVSVTALSTYRNTSRERESHSKYIGQSSTKPREQLWLMGRSTVVQVFGPKPAYWTGIGPAV
ncbi:hypothetical protein EYF80_000602 [Liparis tanakae]|uniref:Uncharacterized protein n=1 Tax=Liparis tanakae TaxID=230148 RepID=A0A4Z2JHU6_9TELE|nr:hypothetical protein EYF80_000602 [Liparis tanakae]